MSAPLVSVLVPSYNHGAFIERTLQSVFDQTYRPIELLVIDDGSKDDSVARIEALLTKAPFPARLIARENRGLTPTLNEGLRWAKGEYFAYLGSDDLWLPERVAKGVEALTRNPSAVMAFSHCYFIDTEDRRRDVSSRSHQLQSGYYFWPMMSGIVGIMSPTPLFRRAPLQQVGWNESARLEDFELYLGLSLLGPFEFIDEPLAAWRDHGNNASKSWALMVKERIAIIDRMGARLSLPEHELEPLRRRVRFEEAGTLLLAGERTRAGLETLLNWRGARSVSELVRRFARLAAPEALVAWRRRSVARGTQE